MTNITFPMSPMFKEVGSSLVKRKGSYPKESREEDHYWRTQIKNPEILLEAIR
ncbi:MAG: hypothetical protein ACFFDN_44185 [Candidatus Hodarchaeota archaeon]